MNEAVKSKTNGKSQSSHVNDQFFLTETWSQEFLFPASYFTSLTKFIVCKSLHLTSNLNPLHFIDKQNMPDEGDFLSYQTVNKCATSKQRKFLSLKDTELNCQLNVAFWMQKPSLCNMEESFRSIYMCMSKNKY